MQQPTREGLEAQQQRIEQQAQQRAQAQQQADAQRDAQEFALTGSDRAADVAMGNGQADMFGNSQTRAQTDTVSPFKTQAERVAAIKAVPELVDESGALNQRGRQLAVKPWKDMTADERALVGGDKEILWEGSEPPSAATGTQPLYAGKPVSQPVGNAPIAQGQSINQTTPTAESSPAIVDVSAPEHAGQWVLVGYEERKVPQAYVDRRGNDRVRMVGDWENAEISRGSGQRIVNIYHLQHKKTGEKSLFGEDTAHQALGLSSDVAKRKAERLLSEKKQRDAAAKAEVAKADRLAADSLAEAYTTLDQRNKNARGTPSLDWETVELHKAGRWYVLPSDAAEAIEALREDGWQAESPAQGKQTKARDSSAARAEKAKAAESQEESEGIHRKSEGIPPKSSPAPARLDDFGDDQGNVALFSRTDAPKPSGATVNSIAAAIKKAYGNVLDKLQANGLVTLTQTQDEAIEAAARARAKATGVTVDEALAGLRESFTDDGADGIEPHFSQDGSIQGFYDSVSGKSFLIADGMTDGAAAGVLAHEVGIHMAADTTSERGKAAMDGLIGRAGDLLANDNSAFMDDVRQRMDDAGETSAEEAAAYIAEAYEADRANAPASIKRWVMDFVAAVRGWLFAKGVTVRAGSLTPADIAAIARANVRRAANARGDGGSRGGVRRSVADNSGQVGDFNGKNGGKEVKYTDGKKDRYAAAESRLVQGLSAAGILERGSGGLVSRQSAEQASLYTDQLRRPAPHGERASASTIDREEARLIARAKDEGFFWDKAKEKDFVTALGKRTTSGTEHDVYMVGDGAEQVVIRNTVKDSYGFAHTSPAQYLQRLADYNRVFPHLQVRMLGVSQNARGNGVVWTAQPFVAGREYKSDAALRRALEAQGWEHLGELEYRHKQTGVVIDDAHKGNVLYRGGELFPIDVIVTHIPDRFGGSGNPETATQPDADNSDIRFSRASAKPNPDQVSENADLNAKIRESDKTLWVKAQTAYQRLIRTNGLLPGAVFDAHRFAERMIKGDDFETSARIGALEAAVKHDYGKSMDDLPAETLRLLNEATMGRFDLSQVKPNVRRELSHPKRNSSLPPSDRPVAVADLYSPSLVAT